MKKCFCIGLILLAFGTTSFGGRKKTREMEEKKQEQSQEESLQTFMMPEEDGPTIFRNNMQGEKKTAKQKQALNKNKNYEEAKSSKTNQLNTEQIIPMGRQAVRNALKQIPGVQFGCNDDQRNVFNTITEHFQDSLDPDFLTLVGSIRALKDLDLVHRQSEMAFGGNSLPISRRQNSNDLELKLTRLGGTFAQGAKGYARLYFRYMNDGLVITGFGHR